MKTLETLGDAFMRKHEWLLGAAKDCEVALCGGVAAAVAKGNESYIPPDIDMVTTKANAMRFLDQINSFLIEHDVHYRVYVNCNNAFVPHPAISHFRVQCPFWLPICLYVLPHDQFRYYRIKSGYLLQQSMDIKKAADFLSENDKKERFASNLEVDLDDPLEPLTIKRKHHDGADCYEYENFVDGNFVRNNEDPQGSLKKNP